MSSPTPNRRSPLCGRLLLAAGLATAVLQAGCATADAGATTAASPAGGTGTAAAKKPGTDPSRPVY